MQVGDKITGTVKWFSKEKGYGFILVHDEGKTKEVFCHITRVKKKQPELVKDMQVRFVVKQGNQDIMASEVEVIV